MYVTPPDTDIYSIPRVLAPMPQKVQPFNPMVVMFWNTYVLCSGADNGFCFDDVLKVEYIRCAMSDYGCYNVTEPSIDAPRDPLYKYEREISKVRIERFRFIRSLVQGFPLFLATLGNVSSRNYLVWFSGYRCLDHCLCIMQVFLTKHYRNRRSNDPEFVLALEEIYVIDSKSKSITRARVLVCLIVTFHFTLPHSESEHKPKCVSCYYS